MEHMQMKSARSGRNQSSPSQEYDQNLIRRHVVQERAAKDLGHRSVLERPTQRVLDEPRLEVLLWDLPDLKRRRSGIKLINMIGD